MGSEFQPLGTSGVIAFGKAVTGYGALELAVLEPAEPALGALKTQLVHRC